MRQPLRHRCGHRRGVCRGVSGRGRRRGIETAVRQAGAGCGRGGRAGANADSPHACQERGQRCRRRRYRPLQLSLHVAVVSIFNLKSLLLPQSLCVYGPLVALRSVKARPARRPGRPAPAVRTCTPEAAWLSSRRQPHRRPLAAIVLSMRSSGCPIALGWSRGLCSANVQHQQRNQRRGRRAWCESQTSLIDHQFRAGEICRSLRTEPFRFALVLKP